MHRTPSRLAVLLILVALLATPGAARAAILGDAAISYSATRTVTVNGQSYTGMVFHIPGHERHEQEIQGIPEVILLDTEAKAGALLLPELNAYVAFPFPPMIAEFDDPSLRRRPLAQETINGVRTTKYRIDHTAADGSHAEGFAWISDQNVLMRIEGTFIRSGASRGATIHMELADVQTGPQDRDLFALPPGLVKLPANAFGALLNGRSR